MKGKDCSAEDPSRSEGLPAQQTSPAPKAAQDPFADTDLLRAWANGDKASGRMLYRRHHQVVIRFFFNKVGPETADLVQKTFLAVLEGAPRFRGEGSFRSWTLGVAYRVMCKHFEQQRRHGPPIDQVSVADLGTSPSRLAARQQEHRLLLEALRRLPLNLQVPIELHYWEGMTHREIAEALGLPLGTVQTRIRRARQRLAKTMEAMALADTDPQTQDDLDRWAEQIRQVAAGPDETE